MKLRAKTVVDVYQKPFTREEFEGRAIVIKDHGPTRQDPEFHRCDVRMVTDEQGEACGDCEPIVIRLIAV
jgi:hypothetical protein